MKIKILLLSVLFLLNNAYAQEDLSAKIDALSVKMDAFQANVMNKLDQLQKNGGGSEDQARAALSEIQSLIAANKYDQAKTKIAEFEKNFAGTQYVSSVERIKSEVEVVGKANPAKWGIEKWYQLEKEVNLDADKPTFVVFWEVWCPHCKREVPKIAELKNKFSSKGVQFVGLTKLSRGTQESELLSFLKENNVNYAIGKENGDISSYYAVSGVPAAVFIKNKKVIWRGHPALVTAEKIEEWIK